MIDDRSEERTDLDSSAEGTNPDNTNDAIDEPLVVCAVVGSTKDGRERYLQLRSYISTVLNSLRARRWGEHDLHVRPAHAFSEDGHVPSGVTEAMAPVLEIMDDDMLDAAVGAVDLIKRSTIGDGGGMLPVKDISACGQSAIEVAGAMAVSAEPGPCYAVISSAAFDGIGLSIYGSVIAKDSFGKLHVAALRGKMMMDDDSKENIPVETWAKGVMDSISPSDSTE